MLEDVGAFDWIRLLFALILFEGPGLALISFFLPKFPNPGKRISILSMGFAFSVSFWAVLFLWLKLINLSITPVSVWVISLGGWAFLAIRYFTQKQKERVLALLPGRLDYLVLFLFVMSCLALLWGIRHEVAGLGSDSFHHTLIAEMIYENGQIPDNYLPFAPIITFSYHYAFHAFIAVLGWLSGWPMRLLVLVSGPVLVGLTGLALGLLVGKITRSNIAEIFSFGVVALLAVFPSFMLNWGRYPQLLGTLLLLIFLYTFHQWHEEKFAFRKAYWLALLAAGLVISHYRVTIMAFVGVLAFLIVYCFNRDFLRDFKGKFLSLAVTFTIALILIAPWFISTYLTHKGGVEIAHTVTSDSSFFSLERLGNDVIYYPTNFVLFAVGLLASIYGLYKRDKFVIWVLLWWSFLFILSSPFILAGYMDRVTFYITLFVPLGLLIGYFAAVVLQAPAHRLKTAIIFSLVSVGLLLWGITLSSKVFNISNSYVRAEDLEAVEWIKANTPVDSTFMVNTFAFPFAPDYIIGSDAGYWLPVLADRVTVVPPMNYQTERFDSSKYIENLILLHSLNGQLATDEAVQILREQGLKYVYVGSKGGIINPDLLISSSQYELKYHKNSNYVFQLIQK